MECGVEGSVLCVEPEALGFRAVFITCSPVTGSPARPSLGPFLYKDGDTVEARYPERQEDTRETGRHETARGTQERQARQTQDRQADMRFDEGKEEEKMKLEKVSGSKEGFYLCFVCF